MPVFALFRESGKKVAGKGPVYRVENFNYGLIVPGEGMTGAIGMLYERRAARAMPAPLAPAIPALPPAEEWVNVHTLGVAGDGTTDDTGAIQKAIDQHRVLYFPSGHYIVSDTLALKPDTRAHRAAPDPDPVRPSGWHARLSGRGPPRAVIYAPPADQTS